MRNVHQAERQSGRFCRIEQSVNDLIFAVCPVPGFHLAGRLNAGDGGTFLCNFLHGFLGDIFRNINAHVEKSLTKGISCSLGGGIILEEFKRLRQFVHLDKFQCGVHTANNKSDFFRRLRSNAVFQHLVVGKTGLNLIV